MRPALSSDPPKEGTDPKLQLKAGDFKNFISIDEETSRRVQESRAILIHEDPELNQAEGLGIKEMIDAQWGITKISPFPHEDNVDFFNEKSFFMSEDHGNYNFKVVWHNKNNHKKTLTKNFPYRLIRIYNNKSIIRFWESFWQRVKKGINLAQEEDRREMRRQQQLLFDSEKKEEAVEIHYDTNNELIE